MELEGEDGSRIALHDGQKTVLGRGFGFHTNDRTVSRRHVEISENPVGSQNKSKVSFEVIGKNPIWVRDGQNGEIRTFRWGDKGEVAPGDSICLSGKKPVWFAVRACGLGEGEKRVLGSENGLSASWRSEFESDDVDVSEIDPVKEFGFLVMGHEFDHYPKQMIRDVKDWDWFLEETRRYSDDDDEYLEKRGKRGMTRKKRTAEDDDGDYWTGESDDDKELVTKLRKVGRPEYSTRSKDRDKPQAKARKHSCQRKTRGPNQGNLGSESDDDETLGGFIVDEDDAEQEEETEEVEEEEEEEFIEDEEEE